MVNSNEEVLAIEGAYYVEEANGVPYRIMQLVDIEEYIKVNEEIGTNLRDRMCIKYVHVSVNRQGEILPIRPAYTYEQLYYAEDFLEYRTDTVKLFDPPICAWGPVFEQIDGTFAKLRAMIEGSAPDEFQEALNCISTHTWL